MARPTMEDVASRAGVSRSLVSLVFQDSKNVSAARRTAVLQAAEELGYRPNRLARNLARGHTMMIGIVVDDLHPFFARAVEGVEDVAGELGYHALIANGARDGDRTAAAVESFSSLQVDGVIVIGARSTAHALVEAAGQIPLVLVSFTLPADGVDVVSNDELMGAALVVDHLASLGHQRILHVDGGQGASSAGRRAGYVKSMHRLGLDHAVEIVEADYTYEAGQKAAIDIANRTPRPTAVFAANDLNALGMISEFNRLGIAVPTDISVVGYDGSDYGGTDGLTTVRQPVGALGARACKMLLERVGQERTEAMTELLSPTLIVRETTAPAPAGATT